MSCTYKFVKGKRAGQECGKINCSLHESVGEMVKRSYKLGTKVVEESGAVVWKCEHCEFKVPKPNRGNLRLHSCYYQKITPMKERFYQKLVEKDYNGRPASCPSGRVDVLGAEWIVEIKKWDLWRAAVGQLMCYSVYFPDRIKCIHLFGVQPADKVIQMIENTCEALGIVLSYYPLSSS